MDETLEIKPLSTHQAQAVTERIRKGLGSVLDDLRTAKEGRAWEPMGYLTWQQYLTAEFEGQSRGNIWRVNNQLEVVEVLSLAAGEPVEVSAREAEKVTRVAKAKVRQTRPGGRVEAGDIVEAAEVVSRARDNDGDLPAAAPQTGSNPLAGMRGGPDPHAMPAWLEQLAEPLNVAAGAAGIDLRSFIIAALIAATEGVVVGEVIERAKVVEQDGASDRAIAAVTGIPKSTVSKRRQQAAASPRWECCGAMKGSGDPSTHARWCDKSGK